KRLVGATCCRMERYMPNFFVMGGIHRKTLFCTYQDVIFTVTKKYVHFVMGESAAGSLCMKAHQFSSFVLDSRHNMMYMFLIKLTLMCLCNIPYTVTRQVRDSFRTKMCKRLCGNIKSLYTTVIGRKPNVAIYAFDHIRDIVCGNRRRITRIMDKIGKGLSFCIEDIQSVCAGADVYQPVVIKQLIDFIAVHSGSV